ncbi:MAG: T9SS type A sorting domain-containing protein [Dysgonamonadaceae bacterium]|jgi:hypothetical protein|nr:T9SS type A sorting domain-containing protein [Dysgonamonadaceae bacterium]
MQTKIAKTAAGANISNAMGVETIQKAQVCTFKSVVMCKLIATKKIAWTLSFCLFSAISGFAQNFTENFEGDVSAWTLVNGGQTNKWVIGSATAYGGSKSAYISNDGTANAYGNTASIVHLYRDVELGVNSTLTFFWKGQGESGYDELKVYLIPTSTTPTAGSQLPDNDGYGNNYLFGTFSESASWKQETIDLPVYGGTKRLVFSWRNDNSSAVQPPIAIDNVVLTTTGDGIGTENNPYLISSKANMEALALAVEKGNDCSGIYFSLTRDLTAANETVTTVIGGSSGAFKGVFDGGGHEVAVKISIKTSNSDDDTYAGVFGKISGATIKNLGVSGSVSSSSSSYYSYSYNYSYSGGICGYASSSLITNCYNTGSVSSSAVASASSYANSNVYPSSYSGGICGYASSSYASYVTSPSSSLIMNCYTTGSVSSSASAYHSYAASSSSRRIAHIQYFTISNCYALSSMTVNGRTIDGSPTSSSESGKSQLLATFQSQSWIEETLGWDFTNIWKMSASNSIYGGLPIFKNQVDKATGIDNIVANKTENIKIYSAPNGITLETKEATSVSVFNIAGQKVHQSTVDGNAEIHLTKGIYIVRVSDESRKVIVK